MSKPDPPNPGFKVCKTARITYLKKKSINLKYELHGRLLLSSITNAECVRRTTTPFLNNSILATTLRICNT